MAEKSLDTNFSLELTIVTFFSCLYLSKISPANSNPTGPPPMITTCSAFSMFSAISLASCSSPPTVSCRLLPGRGPRLPTATRQ